MSVQAENQLFGATQLCKARLREKYSLQLQSFDKIPRPPWPEFALRSHSVHSQTLQTMDCFQLVFIQLLYSNSDYKPSNDLFLGMNGGHGPVLAFFLFFFNPLLNPITFCSHTSWGNYGSSAGGLWVRCWSPEIEIDDKWNKLCSVFHWECKDCKLSVIEASHAFKISDNGRIYRNQWIDVTHVCETFQSILMGVVRRHCQRELYWQLWDFEMMSCKIPIDYFRLVLLTDYMLVAFARLLQYNQYLPKCLAQVCHTN